VLVEVGTLRRVNEFAVFAVTCIAPACPVPFASWTQSISFTATQLVSETGTVIVEPIAGTVNPAVERV
jgi:hypothetical protein